MKKIAILAFIVFCMGCAVEKDDVSASEIAHADLLASRANEYIQKQQYGKALADINGALALAPTHTEYHFLYCLLKERVGEPAALVKACYAEVVAKLSQGDEELCSADMNCVVADLMAEGENAELRRQRLLAMPITNAESEISHYVLETFDREVYLKNLLP